MTANANLCERFGFDQERLSARLRMLGIDPADVETGDWLREKIIGPHLDALVDAQCTRLLRDPKFRQVGRREGGLSALKKVLRAQLGSLGYECDTLGYVEQRLRFAVTLAQLGVPLGLLPFVHHSAAEEVVGYVQDAGARGRALDFLLKIVAYDLSIGAEAYRRLETSHLERSLHAAQAAERKQRQLARRDTLTSLSNRTSLYDHLVESVLRARRGGRPLSVVMIDVDHFKKINDQYGHAAGDEVLRTVAARMRNALRGQDWVGRWGGEEFVAVLHDTAGRDAAEIAERIRRHVGTPLSLGQQTVPVSVSQGVATLESREDVQALVERADAAMYRAKQAGRDRVMMARPAGGTPAGPEAERKPSGTHRLSPHKVA